jgi:putative membrane protein
VWGYGHGWMMNGSGMGFGLVFWLIVLAVIIAGALWFVRSRPLADSQKSLVQRSPALEVLEERYARGEIDREEYLQKKRDITE